MEPEDPGEGGAGATSPPREAPGTSLASGQGVSWGAHCGLAAPWPRFHVLGSGWSCVGLCAPLRGLEQRSPEAEERGGARCGWGLAGELGLWEFQRGGGEAGSGRDGTGVVESAVVWREGPV